MKKRLNSLIGLVLIFYILIINFISSTRIAFSVPIVILGILLILYDFTKKNLKKIKFYSVIKNIIKTVILMGIIVFVIIETAIVTFPKCNKENSEYVLILGAGLDNGITPNLILKERLDTAIRYINYCGNPEYIVLSGGKGNDEEISEAEAMNKYLIDRGIPRNKIIIEDKSRNTYENFLYSKEKIQEKSGKQIKDINVKIITSDFHAFRSSIIAKRNGYEKFNNYSSSTECYLMPVTYTREAFAIVKSLIFDK